LQQCGFGQQPSRPCSELTAIHPHRPTGADHFDAGRESFGSNPCVSDGRLALAQALDVVCCELWELSQISLQLREAGLVGVQQLELRVQPVLIQTLVQAFLLTFKGRSCLGGL
jgi:hypothetical protein